MSKFKKILVLCFALLLILTSVCMANDIEPRTVTQDTEASPIANEEEENNNQPSIINSDLYTAGNSVTISDNYDGNAFVYGQEVTITGQINGDLFVAGNTINIEESAVIYGSVFAFANDLKLNGIVYDVYAYAQNFTLESNGIIQRDLRLLANTFNLNGIIARDAHVTANSIVLPENAEGLVEGNFNYTSVEEANIPEGAVLGEVNFTKTSGASPSVKQIVLSYINRFVNVFIYALVVVLFVTFFARNFADKLSNSLSKRYLASAGVGILATIFVPVVAVVLMLTAYLTYIGIALLTIYCLMLSITISILGIAVGNYLTHKMKNQTKLKFILLSLASVAVIWLLQIIPYVGSWISIFTVVFGFGLLLISIFGKKEIKTTTENNAENSTENN